MTQYELFPSSVGLSGTSDSQSQSPAIHNILGETGKRISNCIDCPYHAIVPDPDKDDWFCDDDIAVLCSLTPNIGPKTSTAWKSGQVWPNRAVTTSCRPYNDRKESETPEWCPIKS